MKLITCPRCRKEYGERMFGHKKIMGIKTRNKTCKLCQAYFHNVKEKAKGKRKPVLMYVMDDSLMFPGMKAQPCKIWQTGVGGW